MKNGQHAIVVGAGLAGLASAQAATPYFERVTLLDREDPLAAEGSRSGVPQGHHAHGLLPGGQRALANLFPDIEEDLAAAGAVPLAVGLEDRVETHAGELPPFDLGWRGFSMSRPLLERVVARRVAGNANVHWRIGRPVDRLAIDAGNDAITGVIVRGTSGDERIAADLVIDASGRGLPTLAALDELGRSAPHREEIGVEVGYATAVFAIPEDVTDGWKGVLTLPDAPRSARGALLGTIEGNRWLLTVSGRGADPPPDDWNGFMAYLQGLQTQTIYRAVKDAERAGPIRRYRFRASIWNRYDRIDRFPDRLIPVGDAICRFNPLYGQGMSVAAIEAVALRRLLGARAAQGEGIGGLARTFLAATPAILDVPWTMAAMSDFLFPTTTGTRPPDFMAKVQRGLALRRLAVHDPAVRRLMFEVQSLLASPDVLDTQELADRIADLAVGGTGQRSPITAQG